MVELELLERGKDAIALLGQLEPAALQSIRLGEIVCRCARPPEKRQCDDDDTRSRKQGAKHERDAHALDARRILRVLPPARARDAPESGSRAPRRARPATPP